MLDSTTRRRIDGLRDILVGKIPTPQGQVEQITTGLIYKFMHDIDVESVAMGGVPSFFVGDYEQYGWKHLFDPKLGGAGRVRLYSAAIENMYTNPTAPPLFREMFKNAYLPFKDPVTLNMFLKAIDEFHYSHSEQLGDAFEYLLSFMGSQGDAGQFRTPRHIIDFIVAIVDPQKHETILDPACGTAGFLISSFKHILAQNTDTSPGDRLTVAERRQIGNHLAGYDISPDMTRLSLVNMYLHRFTNPRIYEYDTLSSDDRWGEYYDVILANPPFFSPKGGSIQPHSRFGVQSSRAEVLFVDYIMDHLKPTGRAGIIVPEGIIFQTGTAYKTLRKKLVEDCLIGVISLPAGVFQPYSGVKTSILILDRAQSRKSDSIFFAKVEHDGFSLGAQRKPTDKNDLPKILESIRKDRDGEFVNRVSKNKIKDNSFILTFGLYKASRSVVSNFSAVKLGEICKFINGRAFKKHELLNEGKYPVLRVGNFFTNSSWYYSNFELEEDKYCDKGDLLYAWSASFGAKIWNGNKTIYHYHIWKIILEESIINKVFLKYLMDFMTNSFKESDGRGGIMMHLTKSGMEQQRIPLPPIEIQQEIVEELEGYQKIINGCRQVVENYKPTIDIDPSWEMVELGEFCSLQNGYAFASKDMYDEPRDGFLPVIKIGNVSRNSRTDTNCKYHEYSGKLANFILNKGDAVIAMTGATVGKVSLIPNGRFLLNQRVGKIAIKDPSISQSFVNLNIQTDKFYNYCQQTAAGGAQGNISGEQILEFTIPKLSAEEQDTLVKSQKVISNVIWGNKKLIEIYTRKIQDRISKVWGE
ncbi:MAG: N-6 DNA methylase [Bacteroidota bacterium]